MNIFLKNIRILSLLAFLCLFGIGTAAAGEPTPEEKAVQDVIKDFCSVYAGETAKMDKKKILAHMSPQLTSTILNYSIRERIQAIHSNYKGFDEFLQKLISTRNLSVSYKPTEFFHTRVKGGLAVSVCNIDFEFDKDGSKWSKGSETTTFTLRKEEGKWKIIHFTVVGIEDEKDRGACLCEVFEGADDATSSRYMVKTTVPNGRSYTTTLNNFEVMRDGTTRKVVVEGITYYWSLEGEIWVMEEGDDGKEKKTAVGKVSKVADAEEAVLVIIKNHLYAGNCSSVKVSR